MWKLVLYYSFIGGVLLLLSRFMDTVFYYLTGYLFFFSYVIIIALTIITAKKQGTTLGVLNYTISIVGILAGMTLLSLLVWILVHLIRIKV